MQNCKKLVFKHCPWYYKYKKLFCDHPKANPPTFIESQQSIYCDSQIVNDIELGEYDKDFQEGELPLPNSGGFSD